MTSQHDELDARISHYLLEPLARQDPYDLLNELRSKEPVFKTSAGPWFVTQHDLARLVLRDPRFSRSVATEAEAPMIYLPGEAEAHYKVGVSMCEGERHSRLRGLVTSWFTPAGVTRWEPMVTGIVDSTLDGLVNRRSLELVRDFSLPIPERVICGIVGIPYQDHALFERWTTTLSNRPYAGGSSDESRKAKTDAANEFIGYLRDLIVARRKSLTDDLISRLIQANDEGVVDDMELVQVILDLLRGGHETTASMITNSVWALLHHPNELAKLKADLSLAPAVVEEVLRFRSSVQTALTRMTTEDVVLGGVRIPAGETVFASYAAANRDPNVVHDPDTFDITRKISVPNLGFGFGRHMCAGAGLARFEIQYAIRELFRRIPDIRPAHPGAPVTWRNHSLISCPESFELEW